MTHRITEPPWLIWLAAAVLAAPCAAADDPGLLKDLSAVMALLGAPCGKVVEAIRQQENDHLVTCQSGHRYRLFINEQGRVVAQPR